MHSLVKAIAGGVISPGQGSVNPVMAPLRHSKLISRQSLCNLDTY